MFKIKIISRVLAVILILFAALSTQAAVSVNLSRTETVRHLENIQEALRYSLQDIFVRNQFERINETAAMATVTRCINSEAVTYWMTEVPVQIIKEVVWRTAHLANALISSNTIAVLIESIEQLTINQSKRIITEWMKENSLRAVSGDLRGFYEDHRREKHRPKIQYTIVYHPAGKDRGRVVAEFRSPYSSSPPTVTSRTVWDVHAWQKTGQKEIPPFIIRISGPVHERNSLFRWVEQPKISVSFPAQVPNISVENKTSFWQKLFGGIIGWGQEKAKGLAARLTPSPQSSDRNEIIKLQDAVKELREIVENGSAPKIEPALDQNLSNLIGDLSKVTSSLSGLSAESQMISKEMAQIAKYSTEIMRWQAENEQGNPSVAAKPAVAAPEDNQEKKPESSSALCQINSSSPPAHHPVVLNEIAWMGRTTSANHEWIELRNISDKKISLAGWQLFNRNQNLMVVFEKDKAIEPQGYFLLVRTNKENVPEASPDLIYPGAVKNRDEAIYLFNEKCSLIDLAQANPEWTAGDNGTKRTMERRDNLEWQTSLLPHGTPRQENSRGYQEANSPVQSVVVNRTPVNTATPANTDTQAPTANAGPDQIVNYNEVVVLNASLSGDNVGIVTYRWDTSNDGLYNHVSSKHTLEIPAGHFSPGQHAITLQVADAAGHTNQDSLIITVREIPPILISEVQFHGATNHDEFIEFYNPRSEDVTLDRWSIRKKTSGGKESPLVSSSAFKGIIPAHSHFLVASPQKQADGTPHYQGGTEPDLYYSGQTYHFAANNTILLYAPNGTLVDKVGYGTASDYLGSPFPDNPPAGMSLGRRWNQENESYYNTRDNSSDFEHQVPTPGQRNQFFPGQEETDLPEQEETDLPEQEDVFQDGSAESPFLLSSCHDLVLMEEHLGAFYRLINDIDCQETEDWNGGQGFRPIGLVDDVPFIGQLDGQGFSITGIHQEQTDGHSGLFNWLSYPARIINLNLKESYAVASGFYSGLLTGRVSGQSSQEPVVIERVTVQGELVTSHSATNAPQHAGGLIGGASRIQVTDSHTNIIITANQTGRNDSTVGGMFGQVELAVIKRCSSRGQISGQRNIGGLIGKSWYDVVIQESYSQVNIAGHSFLGGFIGSTKTLVGTISDNYATGNVIGCSESGQMIGGFVGESNQWIDRSYSIGQVRGAGARGFIGGLPINRTNPVRSSYYDVNTSGRSGSNFGAIGLTTVQMKQQLSFSTWNFEQIWRINDSYPLLRQNH